MKNDVQGQTEDEQIDTHERESLSSRLNIIEREWMNHKSALHPKFTQNQQQNQEPPFHIPELLI